ncbi:hypothetical protein HY642_03435 [Candidatus Woesearchaeota archaeon]|nr:hypothetical protein [Candidatus Woesearchaeota archaeon]
MTTNQPDKDLEKRADVPEGLGKVPDPREWNTAISWFRSTTMLILQDHASPFHVAPNHEVRTRLNLWGEYQKRPQESDVRVKILQEYRRYQADCWLREDIISGDIISGRRPRYDRDSIYND